ncbi:penicillin acylase family protein [Dokdonella sp. MW10]|uniref:penicillin acylase family protein n=1 Tax=Dokdonella sp. MW10 TaxID=2992926 RepID=UPI003F8146F2
MKRIALRSGLAVVVVLALACIAAWFALRGSLARLDGEIVSTALHAPASVERDALGTVTVHGADRHDVTWVLGYVHAQERFFEMDLMRRQAAGELAGVFGGAALEADRAARVHRLRARAQAALALLPQADRDLLDAYRDGVNAGLEALPVRPFPYLLARATPDGWRSEDSLLVIHAMYFALNDAGNARELGFSYLDAALPASAVAFLTASGGDWDAPLQGPSLAWPALPSADELDLRALDPSLLRGTEPSSGIVPGSNSAAVGRSLTGGAALVANDMHLQLRAPNLWFRARLVYPDPRRPGEAIDVTGASLPGAPAIVAGSNRHVAWAFTNSYGDFTDWVRVPAVEGDADRYATPEGSEAIVTHVERLRVHGGDDETLEVRETRWGPITATDADGTPLALAWTAHREGAVNLDLLQLEAATGVDEAVMIAQRCGMPAQNLVVGDRAGNIAWTIAGRIPQRLGHDDPRRPMDWSHAGTGWAGWLEPEAYPLVRNPPGDRLWTANARLLPEGHQLEVFGDGGYDLGARQRQIRDGMLARGRFAAADMLAIQLDDRALFLERWHARLDALLASAEATPSRTRLREALADWSGHASTGSVAYRVVREWRDEVTSRVLDGFAAAVRVQHADFTMPKLGQAEHAVWMLLEAKPVHLLPPGPADWEVLMLESADRVVQRLDAREGGLAAQTWGARNTARIRHPLSRVLPGWAARWLDMPADALPGDANLPRVQGPSFGASERFAVAPGDEENGYFQMPGGQSGHPLSPFHASGHADWVDGTPTPFLPGPARHVLAFRPR